MSRTAIIRTSDRNLYKKCRRQWDWESHLRGNRQQKQKIGALWLGTGFHFALEMMHTPDGVYSDPVEAFKAYAAATKRENPHGLPGDYSEQIALGIGMLEYYQKWLESRVDYPTFIYKDVPQVEVNFKIPIPLDPHYVKMCGYDDVFYSGTIDRVAKDANGLIWLVEYKTAKQIQTTHFANDAQISAYCWAGLNLYPGEEIAGVIYQQHRKEIPSGGRILKSGEVSSAANQKVTHRTYRESLVDVYGDKGVFPEKCANLLNTLAASETEEADSFIRRDKIFRNPYSFGAEGEKILMEASEMINPATHIYPAPKRECQHMCSYMSACVSKDDGSDYEFELENNFEQRAESYDTWREFLKPTKVEDNFSMDDFLTDTLDTTGWDAFVKEIKAKEEEELELT